MSAYSFPIYMSTSSSTSSASKKALESIDGIHIELPASAHTPGPWYVHKDKTIEILARSSREGQIMVPIAEVFGENHPSAVSDEEAKANANLIAASPIMYDFIQMHALNGDKKAQDILSSIHGND